MAQSFLNKSGLPIGLRNNNPGNIRPSDNWLGMIGTNGGFVQFKDIAWGIRAMATDIGNDIRLKGKDTIAELIAEYAPPSENDTQAYVQRVVSDTGYAANEKLPLTREMLFKLIRAQMNVELGTGYAKMITDADVNEGLDLLNPSLLDYFKAQPVVAGSGLLLVLAAIVYFFFKRK